MKQKDIALIVVIAAISAVISVFASKALFSTPKGLSAQVETVEKISADFPQPDTRYFNEKSIVIIFVS